MVQLNDVHVHLGKFDLINKETTISDIIDLKYNKQISKILLIQTSIDHDVTKLENHLHDGHFIGWYGLQWITEHHIPKDLIEHTKMIGCKYHGSYNNHSRPSFQILEKLHEQKKVLMFHTGRYRDGNISSRTSYLHALEVGRDYPNIKVIMAHMGGTDTTICIDALNDSQEYPNIYFDTSGITTPFIVEEAVKIVGSKRIMFGSDYPWCSWQAMYSTVDEARINEEDKQNIFSETFNALL